MSQMRLEGASPERMFKYDGQDDQSRVKKTPTEPQREKVKAERVRS